MLLLSIQMRAISPRTVKSRAELAGMTALLPVASVESLTIGFEE